MVSNALNPLFSYFISEDRLVRKAILFHTKRRQHLTLVLPCYKWLSIRAWNSIIKIKFTWDRTEKSHFKVQNSPFIDVVILLLASHTLQVLSCQKRKCHEIWISSVVRTVYLNHVHLMVILEICRFENTTHISGGGGSITYLNESQATVSVW